MLEIRQARRAAIVVAHPDDETIGAGALLRSLRNVWIIHTTDGSPRNLADAKRSGFDSREEYAAARRGELLCAMALAGVPRECLICSGFVDQETMLHLPELCESLSKQLARLEPDVVVTQPYEGGHPDHDSTAFAVHRCVNKNAALFEMTSYHARDGSLETGKFLANGEPATVIELSEEEASRKQKMLDCFRSQQSVLRDFSVVPEQFRRAPRYDFSEPPHPGVLHYETLRWGITGQRWRELAAACG